MFGNLGTHVIQFPSKRWGFVGSLPLALGHLVGATASDILGCRTIDDGTGNPKAAKFPSFGTEREARDHAAVRGVDLAN